MIFKSVNFRLKGSEATYRLSARKVFLGRNRVGKTSIRDALLLATTGKHPAGVGELGEDVEVSLTANAAKLSFGDDGWTVSGMTEDAARDLMPSVGDMLKGDRLCREEVYRYWGPEEAATPRGLDKEQRASWQTAVSSVGDDLANLAAHFRSEKMRMGREIPQREKALTELRDRTDDGGGAEALAEHQAFVDAFDAAGTEKAVAGLETAYFKIGDKISDTQNRIAAARRVLDLSTCPTCGASGGDLASQKAIAGEKLPARELALKGLRAESTAINQRLIELQGRLREYRDRKDQIVALSGAGADRDRIDSEAETIRRLKRDQALAKELETAASREMTRGLKAVKDNAETAVNSWMPQGFRAVLEIDSKRCRWSVVGTDGSPHGIKSMAGSEKAALVTALMAATGGSLLFLDDLDLAGVTCENLTRLLERLGESDLPQILVVLDPDRAHRIPQGWDTEEIG